MVAGDEKPTFRCLGVARYAVASTVTVLVLVVILYAVAVVLHPEDLTLKVIQGYASVKFPNPGNITLEFTVRAINPSGHFRVYYTGIIATFSGQINGSATPEEFILFHLPDFAVEKQSYTYEDTITRVIGQNDPDHVPPAYFKLLFNGGTIPDAILKLNGTRIFEDYSGHNTTKGNYTVYYCPYITVGGEDPGDKPDAGCTDHLPYGASS